MKHWFMQWWPLALLLLVIFSFAYVHVFGK
jgi:hypothetical protein